MSYCLSDAQIDVIRNVFSTHERILRKDRGKFMAKLSNPSDKLLISFMIAIEVKASPNHLFEVFVEALPKPISEYPKYDPYHVLIGKKRYSADLFPVENSVKTHVIVPPKPSKKSSKKSPAKPNEPALRRISPSGKNEMIRYNFLIDKELLGWLQDRCLLEHRSVSATLRMLVGKYVSDVPFSDD